MKHCPKCDEDKPFSAFHRKRSEKYGPDTIAGYNSDCKDCVNKDRRRHRLENKEKTTLIDTNSRLKRTYGISLAEYNYMLMNQKFCCKGCSRHRSEFGRDLAVDHCHETGRVRGLLCHGCNAAIGLLKENVKTLANLITYLSPELAVQSNILTLKSVMKAG